MNAPARALTGAAFATLLLIALLFAANHVAARLAFGHGTDVATAVTVRSGGTALVIGVLLWLQGARPVFTARHRRMLPLIGVLVGLQSLCIYAAVARLPVALALLAFNVHPLTSALWAWLLYRKRPERTMLMVMPVILVGLALALDVAGAASGLGASGQWARMGVGVAFALVAGAIFSLAMVLTQHEAGDVDGRVRSATTMAIAALVGLAMVSSNGGFALPQATPGWIGLAGLTVFYGSAFTLMFTLLPRLGVVGNSPILSIEPVIALVLAWLLLGESIALMQVAGAALVVGSVMALGMRKR